MKLGQKKSKSGHGTDPQDKKSEDGANREKNANRKKRKSRRDFQGGMI